MPSLRFGSDPDKAPPRSISHSPPRFSSPLLSVASCPCPPDTTPFRSRFDPGAQCSPTLTLRNHCRRRRILSLHHAMTLHPQDNCRLLPSGPPNLSANARHFERRNHPHYTFRAVALNLFPARSEPKPVCSLIVRLEGDALPRSKRFGFLASVWPQFVQTVEHC